MKKAMKLMMVFSLVAALALVPACAHMSGDGGRTRAEGLFAGAGIGALLGAGAGYLLGGKDGAKTGAAIGAGIGAIGGAIYGNHVANKKAQYATEEEWLAECLAQAKASNEDAVAYNKELTATLAEYKAKGEAADAQKIAGELDETGKVLAALNQEITEQKKVVSATASNPQTQELQKQIDALEKQKKQMEKSNKELAAISSRVAI